MIKISGILLAKLPFNIGEFVGVLLYQEFPATIVYSGYNDEPIISDWIDCDDKYDRLVIYKTTRSDLKRYLDGEMSRQDLINYSEDGLVYVVDEVGGQMDQIMVLASTRIPIEYLPSEDSYFKPRNGVQTQKIVEHFSLNKLRLTTLAGEESLKVVAKDKRSDIFNLHLKKGKGVGHGRVDTNILGSTLVSFDNLYRELALDRFFGRTRGGHKISPNHMKILESLTTEVFHSRAASFVIYLKPKYQNFQLDIFLPKSEPHNIAADMFELFKISKELETLKQNYSNYSDFVFRSYRTFLKDITEHDLGLEIDWTDRSAAVYLTEQFTLVIASGILDMIDEISTEETSQFSTKGKFRAINCNTGSFTFDSFDNQHYSGYFDKLIRDRAPFLTFTKLYHISIERKITKKTGSPDSKINAKIIAYYEIDEEE